MKKPTFHRKTFLIIIAFFIIGCSTNDVQISKNCRLHKTDSDEFELRVNWSFVNDTIRQVEKIGVRKDDEWSGAYDWVFVYGVSESSDNKKCWTHIWDGDVVKVYGPSCKEESMYGRKKAEMYSAEEAFDHFQ